MLVSEVSSMNQFIPAESTKTLSVLKLDNHLCQLSNCFLYLTEAAQLICTPWGCTKEVWFIFFSGCMTQWQPTRGLNFTLAGPGTGNYPKSLWSPRVQAHFTCTILSVHTSPLLESWMSWQNRRNIGHARTQDTHETVNYQSGQITTGRVILIAPHSHASVTCHVLMEYENPNRDKWIPSSTNKIENCINN